MSEHGNSRRESVNSQHMLDLFRVTGGDAVDDNAYPLNTLSDGSLPHPRSRSRSNPHSPALLSTQPGTRTSPLVTMSDPTPPNQMPVMHLDRALDGNPGATESNVGPSDIAVNMSAEPTASRSAVVMKPELVPSSTRLHPHAALGGFEGQSAALEDELAHADGSARARARSIDKLSKAEQTLLSQDSKEHTLIVHAAEDNSGADADNIALSDAKQGDGEGSDGATETAVIFSDDELEQGKPMCCGLRYGVKHYDIMPYRWSRYVKDKTQIKNEIMAGFTVAFAQVSESIAFAFIADVGPLLGLHAAWIIGLVISLFGSRPAMINGATGVRAAVVAPFVADEGVEMLFWIVILIGVIQMIGAVLRVANLVRMIPRPAMIGFVNGLAIILALGQIAQFKKTKPNDDEWLPSSEILWMWFQVAVCVLAAVFIPKIPKIGKVFPPSLVGIIVCIAVEFAFIRPIGYETPTIGDLGKVDGGLPLPFWLDSQYNDIPSFSWETIKTAAYPAFIAAAAGMVEAVMTMEVVNDLTQTDNPRPNQHMVALSIGNTLCGIFGTMGGGATIGLSMINCHNGANGQYRISGIVAAIVLLLMILVASPVIKIIPTASLVGVMVIVCFHTFEWNSLRIILVACMPKSLRDKFGRWAHMKVQRLDVLVIVVVTVVTLLLDLFTAVLIGVLLTAASFAWHQGDQLEITSSLVKDDKGHVVCKVFRIDGPVFFASAMEFIKVLAPCPEDPDEIEIHFKASQVSDFTGLYALNVVGEKYKKLGKTLHLRHLGSYSTKILRKAGHLAEHFTYELHDEPELEETTVELDSSLGEFHVTKRGLR